MSVDYDDWEEKEDISPSSPEAYYAAKAWDAALYRVQDLLAAGARVEGDVGELVALISEEVGKLKTEVDDR